MELITNWPQATVLCILFICIASVFSILIIMTYK
jgi:hypothetical protein